MPALRKLFLGILFTSPIITTAQTVGTMPATNIEAVRLPSLNIPRSGHAVLCTPGGEITVFGGHTTGFVPTPTAEWFDGEAWHTLPMTYAHDQGVALPLSSGKVLLAGGHEQPLGIGQTFTVETYDLTTHTFSSFGCLDHKRCFAAATELDSGRVLISGTWYARDGLELWDGSQANRHIKDVTVARSAPYVLRTSRDNAIVFGELDEHGERIGSCWMVDRTDGAAYEEPFLRKWHPVMWLADWRSDVCFVGDTAARHYAYIIPVQEDSAHLAFALVDGGKFSLLPSDHAIPTQFEGRAVFWFSRFIADRERQCGYLVGRDNTHRLYVLRIDYARALSAKKGKLVLSLYYTDPLPDLAPAVAPILTSEGDLVLAGGFTTDNFNPTAAVYRLPVGPGEETEAESKAWWPWYIAAGILLLLAATLLIIYIGRRRRARPVPERKDGADDAAEKETFERIRQYLQTERRFLSQGLRLTDVAFELGVSDRALSACLRRQGYRSFPDLLNALRIDYACELLRQQPDMKIRALCVAAGFASESAFYSAFSNRMGTTPKQWLADQNV